MTRRERQQIDLFPDSPAAREALAHEALELRCRIEFLLRMTAGAIRPCQECGAPVFYVPDKPGARASGVGKLIPFQADGQSHFKQCPRMGGKR